MLFKIRNQYEQMGNHGDWVRADLFKHFLKASGGDFFRSIRQMECAWRCISGDYSR
jgi:hypothetical protein